MHTLLDHFGLHPELWGGGEKSSASVLRLFSFVLSAVIRKSSIIASAFVSRRVLSTDRDPRGMFDRAMGLIGIEHQCLCHSHTPPVH